MSSKRDNIYAGVERPGGFVFDETVAEVFTDMISRSVPGYRTTLTTIANLAAQHVQPDSRVYDLGCSLGAASLAVSAALDSTETACEIVAVDTSDAMLKRWRDEADQSPVPIRQVQEDIRTVPLSRASMVILNFTLQFVPLDEREALLRRICNGCLPGGCLVLSEKVEDPEQENNAQLIKLHHDFKRAHGYSELEISRKRAALEAVLIPETVATHQERMKRAGFARSFLWYQCFNFVSFVAFK